MAHSVAVVEDEEYGGSASAATFEDDWCFPARDEQSISGARRSLPSCANACPSLSAASRAVRATLEEAMEESVAAEALALTPLHVLGIGIERLSLSQLEVAAREPNPSATLAFSASFRLPAVPGHFHKRHGLAGSGRAARKAGKGHRKRADVSRARARAGGDAGGIGERAGLAPDASRDGTPLTRAVCLQRPLSRGYRGTRACVGSTGEV